MAHDTFPRIALDALQADPSRAIGATMWHGVPQVVTRNGVAVAALVPLGDLRHLQKLRDDESKTPH